MEKKMENEMETRGYMGSYSGYIWVILALYGDNGKENGNYYNGLYADNGSYYNGLHGV